MMRRLKLALAAIPLALGIGSAQSMELELRVVACAEIVEYFEEAYKFRHDDVPIVVAYAVLVDDPALHPVQRWVVRNTIDSVYRDDPAKLPDFQSFRTASFAACLVTLGGGALELKADGPGILDKPNLRKGS